MSNSKGGMLVFGVQFLWEVIGSNFSTSESAMTPKLLHRGFFMFIKAKRIFSKNISYSNIFKALDIFLGIDFQ